MNKKPSRKLLLIGWDAADWKAINPLMDAGLMPNLEKLVNGGVMGRLATLDPPLSPMLWTSIGTGKRPYKHGIHGFVEPSPDGSGVRPVHGSSRKVKALWNILTQQSYKTHLVGWWPSHPAEPINGVCISNFYQKANTKSLDEKWEMLDGTVYPKEKSDFFANIRIHPHQLTQAHLFPFLPNAASLDQTVEFNQKRLDGLRSIIAETATIHNAATYILEHEEWDFLGVYYDGIDHFGHGFMKYHPPKMDHISQEDFEMWNNVVTAGYRFHDMMLGRLMKLAGEDATIMLISDHGFHPDHLRPKSLPLKTEHAAPALEHSPYGIFVCRGEGVRKDETVFGASILDITPTILHHFNLPVGEDMDGKVLITAFEQQKAIQTVKSWEEIEGEAGMHPADFNEDPEVAAAIMKQLIDLGYVEEPKGDAATKVQKIKDMNNYFLARAYIDAHNYKEAIPMLEELWKKEPERKGYGTRLAECYQQTSQFDKAAEIIEALVESTTEDTAGVHLLKAGQLISGRKFRSAIEELKKAEAAAPNAPKLYLQIGQRYMALKKWEDAKRAYDKELKIDPDNAMAYYGRGLCYFRLKNFEMAADSFLTAVGLLYHFPFAHYHFGETLLVLGRYKEAAEAFEVCLTMNPNINKARQRLIRLYTERLGQPEKAKQLVKDIQKNLHREMIIVSGLPRSGTSMMMQILEKGGLDVFTDKKREADTNNPKGYYEHEGIKNLMRDQNILKEVGDKAVKIIAQFLMHLPAHYRYKVIFMERDLSEVLDSQHNMLERLGKIQEGTHSLTLRMGFEQTLKKLKDWLPLQNYIDVLYINHRDAIENPLEQAQKVQAFLQKDMNTKQMASVVDASLYRERTSSVANT